MAQQMSTVRKLLKALQFNNVTLLLQQRPFMSSKTNKAMTYFVLVQPVYNAEKDRYENRDVYASVSLIRIMLYLADSYNLVTKKCLQPTSDEWAELRKDITHKELSEV